MAHAIIPPELRVTAWVLFVLAAAGIAIMGYFIVQ